MGCTVGPRARDYQAIVVEPVESPFFYVPPLNLSDYQNRSWILLAESANKNWFYDPYTLTEDVDGIVTFDAFILPREKNTLAQFNATMVGPYRQKIDCFGNNQWSETFYTEKIIQKNPLVGLAKPVNGSGWVKIAPRTAMAYVRTRLCGRKFIDDKNVNYFLYQDGLMPLAKVAHVATKSVTKPATKIATKVTTATIDPSDKATQGKTEDAVKTPSFYDVVNNQVSIIDTKNNIRQMKIASYALDKDLSKKQDYIFTADCQNVTYSFGEQKSGSAPRQALGEKDTFSAVAFDRACGDHGAYVKFVNQGR